MDIQKENRNLLFTGLFFATSALVQVVLMALSQSWVWLLLPLPFVMAGYTVKNYLAIKKTG